MARHRMRARRQARQRMSFRDVVASLLVRQLTLTLNGWVVLSGLRLPAPTGGAPTITWGQR